MNDKVSLRDVRESDLETFFTQQLDPEATRMAAFPARDRDAFFAHWKKVLGGTSVIVQAVILEGEVAGNVVSWEQDGVRKIGYWIGRAYWGKGVASAASSSCRQAQCRLDPGASEVRVHNFGRVPIPLGQRGARRRLCADAELGGA